MKKHAIKKPGLKGILTGLAASAALWSSGWGIAHAVPVSADVISIVDESGSMSTEHAWLGPMISGSNGLAAGLQAAGVGTGSQANRYGLTGFGGGGDHFLPHAHTVGSGDLGSASEFDTATGGLVLSGTREDGWAGINFALTHYSFNAGAARNLILVTDEDRDNTDSSTGYSLDYSGMQTLLTQNNALLNAVVNASIYCGDQSTALGIDSSGTGYKADGSGGFTTCSGAYAAGGFGTTIDDYVNLALSTGGAAWDLNQLRASGLTADSFTSAFVDIKVREIVTPPNGVPEPGVIVLLGIGLLGMGLARVGTRSRPIQSSQPSA